MPLKDCTIDPEGAYIEITIKTKVMGDVPQSSSPSGSSSRNKGLGSSKASSLNNSMMLKMPTIEERESEHDNVEELERKKKEYLNKVSRLNNEVDTLKQDLTKM